MATKNPQSVAKKWATNLGAATAAIQEGVRAVTVAPGLAAARQKSVYVQRVQERQDVWARNVAAVPLSEWQSATETKGIPRIAQGATAAIPKMDAFMAKLLPYIQNQVSALPPRGTLEQNIARSTAFIRAMAKFQR